MNGEIIMSTKTEVVVIDTTTTTISFERFTNEFNKLAPEFESFALKAGRLFIEAKEELGHGNFLKWLQNEIRFSVSTANRFMNLAGSNINLSALTNLGISKSYEVMRLPENVRECFISESYKVNGEMKAVTDMSVREVAVVVRRKNNEIKGMSESNKSTKRKKTTDESMVDLNENFKFAHERIKEILKFIKNDKNEPAECENMRVKLRSFCDKILQKLDENVVA
jgi:hypothetical protein